MIILLPYLFNFSWGSNCISIYLHKLEEHFHAGILPLLITLKIHYFVLLQSISHLIYIVTLTPPSAVFLGNRTAFDEKWRRTCGSTVTLC
jgi:hypothetical protein